MPCLFVWYFTISHVYWCGASLLAMSAGVLPYYRPCLLALGYWSLHLYYSREDGRRMVTSLVLHLQGCNYIRHPLIPCHSQICLLVQCNLSDMHAGFIYSVTHVCKALSGKASGLLQIHQACLQEGCHSDGFVKFVSYYP